MKQMVTIMALISINIIVGWLLYFFMINSQQLQTPNALSNDLQPIWDESNSQYWEEQAIWLDYLALNVQQTSSFYYKTDKNYWLNRKVNMIQNEISKGSKQILTDLRSDGFNGEILGTIANTTYPEYQNRAQTQSGLPVIPTEIDIFYTKASNWHEFHAIGIHFLWEGQRYNHIIGHNALIHRSSMIASLREYASAFPSTCVDAWDIVPQTYDLGVSTDWLEIMDILGNEDDEIQWIGRSGDNIGQENVLYDNQNKRKILSLYTDTQKCYEKPNENFIIQKYIANQALISDSKFLIRAYMIYASVQPLMVLYFDGFVTIQDPDKTTWTFNKLQQHLIENNKADSQWLIQLRQTIKLHMLHIARATFDSLLHHPGLFEIFAIDFILDSDLHPRVIDILPSPAILNSTPDLEENSRNLLSTVLEIQFALVKNSELDDIINKSDFEWVYDGRQNIEGKYLGLASTSCL